MEPYQILLSAVGSVLSLISGLILYRIKRIDKKQDEQDKAIQTLETRAVSLEKTSVTDGHVRTIVREEMEPLTRTVNRMADGVEVIKDYIAEKRGEEKALAKIASARRSSDSGNQ